MTNIDLHIHSSYSDGSDSVSELVRKIIQAGINVFALTDHDTNHGCIEIMKYLPKDIKFIPGIELTSKVDDIKCHILGLNCKPDNEKLKELIFRGKGLRRNKLERRIQHLKDVWNIELTDEELKWLYSRNSVVKIHIANILVNRGLSDNNIDAMKKYLDACQTGNSRFDGHEAITVIKQSGGIPIWAHPLGGEGEEHLTPDKFLPKLAIMLASGIQGLECYYSRYSNDEIEFLTDCAKKYNIFISGGSDYHGTNKDIPLGMLNKENKPVSTGLLTVLKQI